MKHILLIMVVLLTLIIPTVAANDMAYLRQNVTLWADILDGSTFYSANQATITIYLPNTSLIVSNQNMSLVATGRYAYQFVPNVSGTHYTYTQYYNSTGLVATASGTFFVQEESESMYLAILFGVVALIVGCFWYANSMRSKPITQVNTWIIESLSTRDLAVAFDIIGTFMFMPLLALLQIWSEGTEYASIFNTLFIAGSILIGFGVLLYLVMYLIYRYNEGIEAIGNAGSEKGVNRNGKQRR